ncbi:MAG TPA: phosphate ABC transporter substrate-binding protein [Ktedonobacterales bacterium]|nr:phosphate ABC transporter substrate-binding protein [Ktedonobacterales bacterium]
MFLFSPRSRRSTLSSMALATGLLLLTMLLSACGGSGLAVFNGSTPTPFPAAVSCSVSAADLGPGGSGKGTAPNDKATGTITVDGSSLLEPLVSQASKEYLATNTKAKITVNAADSSTGLSDVESGKVQIGMSDLFAKDVNATTYANLVDHQLGVVIFALVVNPDVAASVTNLTTQQIQQIFDGQITDWSALGGPNEQITVIGRPTGSETDSTFTKYVMQNAPSGAALIVQDDNSALGDAVSSTPGAIGYIATSFIGTGGKYKGKVVPVCVDGQKPSPDAAASNAYQFWSIEHLYTKGQPTGLAASFIKYMLSSAFQTNDLTGMYFLPVSKLSAAALAAHQP